MTDVPREARALALAHITSDDVEAAFMFRRDFGG